MKNWEQIYFAILCVLAALAFVGLLLTDSESLSRALAEFAF
jgi:hypothetical protein